jgi:DNA mismatch repair protein MutL
MADLIKLLPDSVANQIAAGEVVQRPASAVKELLENAIDSGASHVKLIIKDAGKALLQVMDDGCGMSERDARMCFERHATSKIETADDLLRIHTLGFRGEALASIAQVELKSKRTEDELGTCIQIEGSDLKAQFPTTCQDGTSVAVKNLFFNVPARRNFLKSNTLELKYIIDEFFRVALIYHDTAFTFINNDKVLYQVAASNLKQRIVALFGNTFNQKLIPVEQHTAIVNITGFIGKPEFAKKKRGDQFFFANKRFIKNPYLNHAIENAFQELIPKDAFPAYFIYLEMDPKTIDVNIHPTKTEINFQDIKSIYAILNSSIRQTIGRFNLTPAFDFERESAIDIPPPAKDHVYKQPTINVDPNYNPFEKKTAPQQEISGLFRGKSPDIPWQTLYDPLKDVKFPEERTQPKDDHQELFHSINKEIENKVVSRIIQSQNRFIITYTKGGIVIMDQQNAHIRILYEHYMAAASGQHAESQKQLLPQTLNLSPGEAELVREYLEEFHQAGFEINEFGNNSFIISAIPSGNSNDNIPAIFEAFLETLQNHPVDQKSNKNQQFALYLAKSTALKRNQKLQPEEMGSLVERLFACKIPDVTPDGKPTMILIGYDELTKKFK